MNKIEDLNLEELTPEQLHELMYKIYNYYRDNARQVALLIEECHYTSLQQGRCLTAQLLQVFKLSQRLAGMPRLAYLSTVNESIYGLFNAIEEHIDWERTDDEKLRNALTQAKIYFNEKKENTQGEKS